MRKLSITYGLPFLFLFDCSQERSAEVCMEENFSSDQSSSLVLSSSLVELLDILLKTNDCTLFREVSFDLTSRMQERGLLDLIQGSDLNVYSTFGEPFPDFEFANRRGQVLVFGHGSPLEESLLTELNIEERQRYTFSVLYTFVSPHVPNCAIEDQSASLEGLSLGKGHIFLRSRNASEKIYLQATYVHEAEHLLQDNVLPRLKSERKSYLAGADFLERQVPSLQDACTRDISSCSHLYVVEDLISDYRGSVAVADYLLDERFQDLFAGTYPFSRITAPMLLEADIGQQNLLTVRNLALEGSSSYDIDLATAAGVAYIAEISDPMVGVQILYNLSKRSPLIVERENASLAIDYIFPPGIVTKTFLFDSPLPYLQAILMEESPPQSLLDEITYIDSPEGNKVYPLYGQSLQ